MQVSIFNDTLEGVPHVRDQHVEHEYLREEGRQNEEKKAEVSIRLLRKTGHVIQTNGHVVLVQEQVDDPRFDILLNHGLMFAVVHVEHEERHPEEHQSNNEQDDERSNVLNCLRDQQDVESGAFEQPHPVVGLQYLRAARNRSQHSQFLDRDPALLEHARQDNAEDEGEADEVIHVPKAGEVAHLRLSHQELVAFVEGLIEPEAERYASKYDLVLECGRVFILQRLVHVVKGQKHIGQVWH